VAFVDRLHDPNACCFCRRNEIGGICPSLAAVIEFVLVQNDRWAAVDLFNVKIKIDELEPIPVTPDRSADIDVNAGWPRAWR